MPGGHPPKLTPDLVQKIGNAVAGGLYKETASALHDVPRGTFHRWLRRGAEERQRVEKAVGEGLARVRVRARERIYVELCDTVERAVAAADGRDLSVVDRRAQGGLKSITKKTRTRSFPKLNDAGVPILDANGVAVHVVEVTTEETISESLPEWTAAAWKLERRDPKNFGRRTYRELSGPGGQALIPLEVIRAALAGAGEIEDADWEIEPDGSVPMKQNPVAGLLKPGADASLEPVEDLPEE